MDCVQAVGLSYHKTPIELRQLVAMSKDIVVEKLTDLKRHCRVKEAAILSTCNRTEVYFLSAEAGRVSDWMSHSFSAAVEPHLYHLQNRRAVEHLFRVTCGLDSQLIGENEIVGQVKQFSALARAAGSSGAVINRLLEKALAAAKEVRTATDIGKNSTSYAALVMQTAAAIFPNLQDCSVLFVGAGDMAVAGGNVFKNADVKRMAVASRDIAKAEKIAVKFGGEAVAISRLADVLPMFDIIITATASQLPIIGKGAVERALKARLQKPMLFADLALPNDLEPEIKQLPDVFVYNLDQFAEMAMVSREKRQLAAQQATPIIDFHVSEFLKWLKERDNLPKIIEYRQLSAAVKQQETDRCLAELQRGGDPAEVVSQAFNRLTRQLMHLPTRWLSAAQLSEADEADEATPPAPPAEERE